MIHIKGYYGFLWDGHEIRVMGSREDDGGGARASG